MSLLRMKFLRLIIYIVLMECAAMAAQPTAEGQATRSAFDFSRVPGIRVQDLAHVHESIRAVASLGRASWFLSCNTTTISRSTRFDDWASTGRNLGFSLKSEPGIVLNIAAVEVPNDCQT